MQKFGVTNKEYYGMLLYFLEWSIVAFNLYIILKKKTTNTLSHGTKLEIALGNHIMHCISNLHFYLLST